MKAKQSKENEVQEGDQVSKGNQKWYQPIKNKINNKTKLTKTQNRKQDQSRVPTEE